jgi:hypothetical protein
MSEYLQGEYEVKNKSKYVGTRKPRYLSSWELKLFEFLDGNPNIIRWGSETAIIPYYSPADGRNRRYMIDLFIEYKTKDGIVVKELIEVKPFAQTQQPKMTGRKKKETYLRELYTYQVNLAKWQAATEFARKRKMNFRILTEKDIFR